MARNRCDDAVQIAPRCLAVVFRERRPKRQEAVADGGPPAGGEQLFRQFIAENECCFWNPHLQESIRHLKFEGYFQPNIILVTGRDIYLDTVRAAWSQRTIRPPKGYSVHRVGEICGVSMMPIPQSQFTPLPEALCIAIYDLTKNNEDASFDAIMEQLKSRYKGLQQPTEQITYQTLASLIKERKIYHTGRGYHILSADLYQPGSNNITVKEHHLVIGGTDTADGVTPMLYIPLVQQTSCGDKRSISCQTETKMSDADGSGTTEKSEANGKKNDKSPSGREEKKTRRDGFVRSASLRYNDEKCKNLVKDINLKTSDINQDKDKGEKSSLFSKLFGRNKTKDSGSLKEEDKPDMVEHVTFSAQFPPQEWGWYEAQLNQHVLDRSPSDCHDPLIHQMNVWSGNSLCVASDQQDESSIEAVYHEIHNHSADCPMALSFGVLPTGTMRRSSSHSGSWSSLNDVPCTPAQNSHMNSSQPRSHHRRDRKDGGEKTAAGDVHHSPPDVRPKFMLTDNRLHAIDKRQHNMFDEPLVLNNAAVLSPDRPSHVTKVFRKYREMKCNVPCTNDISVEYCGRIQRKDSQLAKSRDSGVNCIGLGNSSQPRLFSSHHYNTNGSPLNNQLQSLPNGTEGHSSDPNIPMASGLSSRRYEGANSMAPMQDDHSSDWSKSPGQLSSDDRYPSEQTPDEVLNLGNSNAPYHPDHLHPHRRIPHPPHHDSEVSIWSDNSRQTVREVLQPARRVHDGSDHSSSWSHPDSQKCILQPNPLCNDTNASAGEAEQSKHRQKHAQSRSKSPLKHAKDGEKSARPKNITRPNSSSGKTLANHVYESHQKVASRHHTTHKTTDFRH